jgi:hypothetical protein
LTINLASVDTEVRRLEYCRAGDGQNPAVDVAGERVYASGWHKTEDGGRTIEVDIAITSTTVDTRVEVRTSCGGINIGMK